MSRSSSTPPPAIPDYELIREIGRGSYGAVWLGRSVTGLYRAIKLVWRASFEDGQPFEREFRGVREFAAISLQAPRQLALLHVGRNDAEGFFYYVMELADDVETGRDIDPERYRARTLKDAQPPGGRMLAPAATALAVELAECLAELHRRKLVHRDIKPSNILFVGGTPKLADIGLVAAARSSDLTLSRVGNPGYMPHDFPGQPSADVYGLGKVFYELATGRHRDDFPALPAGIGAFPDRRELLELNEILTRACAPQPEARYTDADALLEDLRLLQAGKSVRRLRNAERRLSRALRWVAVLGVATALAGAGAGVAWKIAQEEAAKRAKAEAERDAIARKSIYSAGLSRAQRALETGELGRARVLLQELIPAAGQPDLRGFEWHALWREAQGDKAHVLRDSGATVVRTRVSPDGDLIALHTFGQTVTVWDAATRAEKIVVRNIVDFAGFSSDGQWLVGTDKEFRLQRWSVFTGQPQGNPAPGAHRPLLTIGADQALGFIDGSGGKPHVIRRWDFAQNVEVARLEVPRMKDGSAWDFFRATATPDGKVLALALIAGRAQNARWRLQLYDLTTHRLLFDEFTQDRISALGLTADGSKLATAFGNVGEIALFDVGGRRWLWRKALGDPAAKALAFSPDGSRLAVAGSESVVRIIDPIEGTVSSTRRGHASGIEDIAWSALGDLVSGGSAGDIRLWPANSSATAYRVAGLERAVSGGMYIRFSPSGQAFALSGVMQGIRLHSTATLNETGRFHLGGRPLLFSKDERELWVLGGDGALLLWEVQSARLLRKIWPPTATTPTYPDVAVDRRLALYGDTVGHLHWCDLETGSILATHQAHRGTIWWAALTRDGLVGFSSGEDRRLVAWNAVTRQEIAAYDSRYGISHAAASPDGKFLAVAMSNGILELRRIPGLQLEFRKRTDNAFLRGLAFSPTGDRLWCTGSSGEISVYATDDWREVLSLSPARKGQADNRPANIVAMDDTSSVLSLYTEDGQMHFWRR